MRAYQLPKGGAGIDALVKVERPDPKPAYRQVKVKVKACSLNFRDLGIVRGTYRMPVRENLIPLSDGAGEVIEVGPGVTRVKVGDRVAGCFFQRWVGGDPPADVHTSALGGGIDGIDMAATIFEGEAELAVVIGKRASHVKAADAMSYVFGYTNFIDGSARGVVPPTNVFYQMKSRDTFAPIGPYIVTADEIKDPHKLQIRLTNNGVVMQNFN